MPDFWHFNIMILKDPCGLASSYLSRLIFYHGLDIYDQGILNSIICPIFIMPFYTSISFVEVILSACKTQPSPHSLNLPKRLLTSKVQFGYHLPWEAFIILSTPTLLAAVKFSLYSHSSLGITLL